MRILMAGISGSVGSSLARIWDFQGFNVVPLTSRIGSTAPRGAMDLPSALEVLRRGDVDAVVNAAGPGDHRGDLRQVGPFSRELSHEAARSGVPAVLISTLRVCEGATSAPGDDEPSSPITSYAAANAAHEEVWLEGDTAVVLRLSNYFCLPTDPESPQRKLLPWSLLLEGWETGHISVRSDPSVIKEFVSAEDAARAIVTVIREKPFGRRLASLPGFRVSMLDLVAAAIGALESFGVSCTASFVQDSQSVRPISPEGWLMSHGWESHLSLAEMQQTMQTWLIEWGLLHPIMNGPKES